ncbi:protein LTO1 homolog [Schistocerca piceifrons]|uniref:protein LTO1 homolog n=1 Tax=Schistocerca piceifrons TaxID=274613 RepID=UPI001F5E9D47|nr:protein LTO1 homolog [Schistocerca piceifrons]
MEVPIVHGTQVNENDINDVFESLLLSEEKLSAEGFQEGLKKGSVDGLCEGFHLGYHRGAEIGAEIGFYKGVIQAWLIISRTPGNNFKGEKDLEKFMELCRSFPTSNSENEDILDLLSYIRAKYRKLCALYKFNTIITTSAKLSF